MKPAARTRTESVLYALVSFSGHQKWAKQKFLFEHAEQLARMGFNTKAGGAMLYATMREMG